MTPLDDAPQSSLATISMVSALANAFTRPVQHRRPAILPLTPSVISDLRYTLLS